MRIQVHAEMATLTLVPWYDARHEDGARSPVQGQAIQLDAARLRRLMHEDTDLVRRLRGLVGELGQARLGDGPTPDELAAQVARLIERGLVSVVSSPRVLVASETSPPLIEPRVVSEPEAIVEEDHWIEVVLVNEDEQEISGVLCELTLPDGRRLQRRTDHLGMIRVEGITCAGPCELVFPELDAFVDEPGCSGGDAALSCSG